MSETALKDRPKLPIFIDNRREALLALCQQNQVRSIALFGSATRKDFDPEHSDLDFAVEFAEMTPVKRTQHYFALLDGLRRLFERPIDLVENTALHNPYLRAEIDAQRVVLYGA
jgi:predicted nucleotidyltransferase